MKRSQRAMQIWLILISAAHNRQIFLLGQLAQLNAMVGQMKSVPPRGSGWVLKMN